jgi:putative endonuclease
LAANLPAEHVLWQAGASDGKPSEKMMWYVYILKSEKDSDLYIGSTNDLQRRVSQHNSAQVNSTKHRGPFTLEAYIAVKDKIKAIELEQYLKTGSGKAVLQKRIL